MHVWRALAQRAAPCRRQTVVVPADGNIFRGSLANNIRHLRPDASNAAEAQAVTAAGLEGMLDRLPDGLAIESGERGLCLSFGERQRLQIACAILGRRRVPILDERESEEALP